MFDFITKAYAAGSAPAVWDSYADPLVDVAFVANTCTLAAFSANLVIWIVRAVLIVLCAYYLFNGIYKLMTSDSTEDFKILKSAIKGAVLAALGIVIVISSFFLPAQSLRLLGIEDSKNPFLNAEECSTARSEF